MAATSLHDDVLLVALKPTLIRWWEASRAPEVAKWQQTSRVDWDATDGRNGGAQRTVWDVLMEMERFNGKAKVEDQGAVALVLDLAKAFERVSLTVACAWATHFSFPRKILRVLCGYFERQRRVQFDGCAAEPLTTITAILPGSKWSCLLLRGAVESIPGNEGRIAQPWVNVRGGLRIFHLLLAFGRMDVEN